MPQIQFIEYTSASGLKETMPERIRILSKIYDTASMIKAVEYFIFIINVLQVMF